LFIVVSAMGKTTNAMEVVLEHFMKANRNESLQKLEEVEAYHYTIIDELFANPVNGHAAIDPLFLELKDLITNGIGDDYDRWYDRLVSFGEVISTRIISAYLAESGIENEWLDMRKLLVTDSNFREANVRMDDSQICLQETANFNTHRIYIGQGFIGANANGDPTTLGREGSDYSAAVVANLLDAESVTIWKDVPGILNADPRLFENTVLIPELTYLDAVELAYSGAQIIHPKTIKPLQNKGIPLYVSPFGSPNEKGSVIKAITDEVSPILFKSIDATQKGECDNFLGYWAFRVGYWIFNYFHVLFVYPLKMKTNHFYPVGPVPSDDRDRCRVTSLTRLIPDECAEASENFLNIFFQGFHCPNLNRGLAIFPCPFPGNT
jgi:aspartate kinase